MKPLRFSQHDTEESSRIVGFAPGGHEDNLLGEKTSDFGAF